MDLHTLSRLSGSTFGLLSLQLVKPAREKRFVTFVWSWDDRWWLDILIVQKVRLVIIQYDDNDYCSALTRNMTSS